jgi:hypothetical protein
MPRHYRKATTHRRKMKGRGFMDFISKVGGFLKKHKIISRAGGVLGRILPGQYGNVARTVGTAAGSLGYGRRRRIGRGLKLAGM